MISSFCTYKIITDFTCEVLFGLFYGVLKRMRHSSFVKCSLKFVILMLQDHPQMQSINHPFNILWSIKSFYRNPAWCSNQVFHLIRLPPVLLGLITKKYFYPAKSPHVTQRIVCSDERTWWLYWNHYTTVIHF